MLSRNNIPTEVLEVLEALQGQGHKAYLVGGCVRDLLLQRDPKDFDITSSARPEQVKELFDKVVDTGIKHGTVTVLRANCNIEVTTFRIQQEDLEVIEDVKRRDFTVNGLLFDGANVCDYVGGLADLEKKVLRAIGDPIDRFSEDPLRMMRGIRLQCELGFDLEEQTLVAIKEKAALIENIACERIRDELVKILLSKVPARGIFSLQQTGLLVRLLPELSRCCGFEQHNPHHCADVFGHTMAVLEQVEEGLVLRLAALLHDVGKPCTFSMDSEGVGHFYGHDLEGFHLTRKILCRLKFDNKTIRDVSILVKEHMNRKIKKKAALKRLINRVGISNLDNLFNLQIADEMGSKSSPDISYIVELRKRAMEILESGEPLGIKDLAISGKDLIEIGVPEGKAIGVHLRKLTELVLNKPKLNDRAKLLKLVKVACFSFSDALQEPRGD